jgi:hypothetical protein
MRIRGLARITTARGGDDFAAGWGDESLASAVMIGVTIEHWIAWADWD